jgi:hypothetical protein
MRTLKELRCEGVEFNALKLMFCKYILVHLRLRTFYKMELILNHLIFYLIKSLFEVQFENNHFLLRLMTNVKILKRPC